MTSSEPVVIRVLGQPAPQGSKKAFALKKGGAYTGRVAVVEQLDKRIKSWRQAVLDEASKVVQWMAAPQSFGGIARGPLDGPLIVRMIFYLPRPQGHYRTGRNAHLLRDSAPAYPTSRPDTGKLARSTEDALTDAGIWRDDALIVDSILAKRYADPGNGLQPGAYIEIRDAT